MSAMSTRPYVRRWITTPLNSPRGGMRLTWRSLGAHYDTRATERVIGRHVYIFRRDPGRRITVWRLESDGRACHWWTRVHDFRA